ncbi:SDR family oxidoreductase [Streptomyces sp. NPDC029044]|uniref:SDR family oxidoreductase n=1 Tax=Streptomyces sp. NPDC029044 TaxID=3157198 RepID=UPI0033EBDC22
MSDRGIRVNAVAPGFVRTEAYKANGLSREEAEGLLAGVAGTVPLGRVAEPEEIAPWITMPGSAEHALVTGADGHRGRRARHGHCLRPHPGLARLRAPCLPRETARAPATAGKPQERRANARQERG